jgi:DNA topoisomerase-1
MTWDVPVKDDCPECGKTMFKRSGRGYRKPFCINEECPNFLPEDKRGYKRKTAENGENAAAAEPAEGEKSAAPKKTAGKPAAQKTAAGKTKSAAKTASGKKTTSPKKTSAEPKKNARSKKAEEQG